MLFFYLKRKNFKYSPVLRQTEDKYLGRKTNPAALHADLQAVGRLAAGVQDAAVQVAGQVTVGTLAGAAAAAAEA